MIKKAIGKILRHGIKALGLHSIVDELINEQKINDCYMKVISSGAVFYEQTKVFNFQNDRRKITIGEGTHIRGELLVFAYGGNIRVGNHSYIGEGSRVWSGDNVSIGHHVLVAHNVNIIDTNSHEIDYRERARGYADIVTVGHPKVKGSIATSPIVINDHAWISFNATILRGVSIGEGAIVGACAVVTKDVAPWTVVSGNPARIVKQL